MECGLIGLQGVGKTLLFQALTSHAVPVQVGSMKPNIGIASIPDPRLDRIADFIPTEKMIYATIQVVDIPGLPQGATGGALGEVLANIRQVDALCHVVRCFDDGLGVPDPQVAIISMDGELILADLVVVEGAVNKAARAARSGDKEAIKRLAVLEKCQSLLELEKPIRDGTWDQDDLLILKSYGMMTAKPVLFVANVGEDDIDGSSDVAKAVVAHAKKINGHVIVLCAEIESEIAELDVSDRGEMLESMAIAEPALGAFARGANDLMGLATFYTAGEKEIRSWSIPIGASAPEAAGAIHSDLQRGFIRAECYHVDDLFELGNEKAIKEAGKMRSEGKGYAMQDGDVAHILFNV